MALAGLMGGAGVLVGAAGAHLGGGDLTRTASDFLLIHACAVLAGSAAALGSASVARGLLWPMVLWCVGGVLFGGELALAALADWRPLPLAAPVGGTCLIAGWLVLAVTAGWIGLRRAP